MLQYEALMAFKRKPKRSNVEIEEIDYKNIGLLRSFLIEGEKISGRRSNGLSAKKQRKLQKEIKKARSLGLLASV